MSTHGCVQLTTMDEQSAYVQMGSRVPKINGVSMTSRGNETRSATLENVGLIVQITPHILGMEDAKKP